jgi:hypothetical protein
MSEFWPMFFTVGAALVVLAVQSQPRWTSGVALVKRDWGIVTTLIVGLPLLIFSLTGAAFAYHDNDVLLTTTVVGKPLTLGIWPTQGRYFPLFSREFVALAQVSSSPIFYYAFIALQLVIVCLLLNAALAELSVGWRTLACALALSTSGVVILFVEAIYPERNIVFLLLIFIVAVQRFDLVPSRLNMAVGLLAAHTAMYFKEPVFLLIATVALFRLVLATRGSDEGWRSMLRRPLELGLLAASLVFAIHLAILVAGSDNAYVERANIGPLATVGRYLRIDPLFVALLICLLFRATRWRRERRIDSLWDALAAGTIVYFLALVASGLAVDRYMGPVDVIAAMYVVREVAVHLSARERQERSRTPSTVGAGIAAVIVLFGATIATGAFRAVEHRSVVAGTERLANFVSSYAETHGGTARLYFPDTIDYRIMNFAAYLAYSHPDVAEDIVLTAPLEFPDGACVDYRVFRCEKSMNPRPGDLVVHMPDDTTRESAGASRVQVFDYSWLGTRVPAPIGRLLYNEAPLYSGEEMPGRWLFATVERQL